MAKKIVLIAPNATILKLFQGIEQQVAAAWNPETVYVNGISDIETAVRDIVAPATFVFIGVTGSTNDQHKGARMFSIAARSRKCGILICQDGLDVLKERCEVPIRTDLAILMATNGRGFRGFEHVLAAREHALLCNIPWASDTERNVAGRIERAANR